MDIVELYKSNFFSTSVAIMDYSLVQYNNNVLVGVDKYGNCSLVIESSTPNRNQIMQRTKMLSLECNVGVTYKSNDSTNSSIVHVLKCYSKETEDISLFLELSTLFIIEGDCSDEHISDVFRTMLNFFKCNNEPSDIELQGIFAELYAIKYFKDTIHLEKYWQSKDKLKYDFSISETLKIEVKSTIKSNRIHHFKHEQLMTNLYDIYVISFMLKHDDSGLSLYDLLIEAKELFKNDPRRLIKINSVLKNTSKSRLLAMCYEDAYTKSKMKVYRACDIPKFKQATPNGVSNAEYDCDLENINHIEIQEFVKEILLKR